MHYQFVKEHIDYSDLASGRVFCSRPGNPAFPVRLASEIFQRCMAIRNETGSSTPCVLYDPCCGGAYHLCALAYLHREFIREVIVSDFEESSLRLAKRNLDMLTLSGLDKRIIEITEMLKLYGKGSHKEALQSAKKLRKRVAAFEQTNPFTIRGFQADATDISALRKNLGNTRIDIVFTDIPYGLHSQWQSTRSDTTPSESLGMMLDSLASILLPSSLVALVSDKRQKTRHPSYDRLDHFQVGKRKVAILRPLRASTPLSKLG